MAYAVAEVVRLAVNYTGAGPGAETPMKGGGRYIWSYDGTFAGATVTLEYLSPDGSSWVSSGATAAAEGSQIVYVAAGAHARLTYSGAVAAFYSDLASAGITG